MPRGFFEDLEGQPADRQLGFVHETPVRVNTQRAEGGRRVLIVEDNPACRQSENQAQPYHPDVYGVNHSVPLLMRKVFSFSWRRIIKEENCGYRYHEVR